MNQWKQREIKMDCIQTLESWESTTTPTLTGLVKHLQFYNKPPNFNDFVCKRNDDVCVVSSTTTTNSRDRRRAAVLICIFEGNEGELRVVLTKRSMNLSSHPGIYLLTLFCFLKK